VLAYGCAGNRGYQQKLFIELWTKPLETFQPFDVTGFSCGARFTSGQLAL